MSTELVTELRLSDNIMNDYLVQGPADLPYDPNLSAAFEMANDFVPQGSADVAQNAESFVQADVANDRQSHGKPDNEFCEFQYIEIVPLDSPKQAENNNCASDVKEEVKEEPEDVCIVSTLLLLLRLLFIIN